MPRGPVNQKDIAIETSYFYMNAHLELLHKAIENQDEVVKEFQKSQLKKVRDNLLKLGYFERGKKK